MYPASFAPVSQRALFCWYNQVMKTYTLLSVLAATLLFATILGGPSSIFAHDLQFDNNIGALLHIEPADTAVAEQPATLIFHFLDKLKKFTPAACDCSVTVTDSSGTKIFSALLDADDAQYGDDTRFTIVTFPRADVYKVQLSGVPRVASAFPPFSTSYEVRVEKESTNVVASGGAHMHSGPGAALVHTLHFGLFGLAFLAAAIVIVRDKRREKRYTGAQLQDKN